MKTYLILRILLLLLSGSLLMGTCEKDTGDPDQDGEMILEDLCGCHVGIGDQDIIDIVSDESEYRFLIGNIDFFAFYINKIKNDYSMEDMQKLASIATEKKLPVFVELGGVLGPGWGNLTDLNNGKESAAIEIVNSSKWIRAGGNIDYVIFDGPVRRLLYGNIPKNMEENGGTLVSGYFNTHRGPFSYEEAADEILFSMQEWRKTYPEIKFILGCNFPNWGWKGEQEYHSRGEDGMHFGDYHEVIQVVMDRVQSSDTPFSGLIVDFPYNYAIGARNSPIPGNDPGAIDWISRIRELENYVRARGLEFLLYTNTEEQASDSIFCEGTLNYVDLYRERGGAPDRWLVQTWYPVPARFGPENIKYTMAWLVNEVNRKLNSE